MRRSYGKVLFKQSPHRGQQAKPLNLILEILRAQRWRAELFYSNNQNISAYSTLVSIGLCYVLVSCDNYTKSNCWVSTKFHGAKRPRKIRKFWHWNVCIPVCCTWILTKRCDWLTTLFAKAMVQVRRKPLINKLHLMIGYLSLQKIHQTFNRCRSTAMHAEWNVSYRHARPFFLSKNWTQHTLKSSIHELLPSCKLDA